MRLFLGIYPPKEVLDYIRDVKRSLDKEKRNLRFVEPERLHITLRFIGSKVEQATKNKISAELQRHAGSYPKPKINIEGISLGFPRQKDPRIIMANIEADYELEELVHRLHKNIRSLKRRDTITWKQRNEADFHITIGRLKPSATKHTGYRVQELIDKMHIPAPEPFYADEMYLVSSEPTNNAPVYKKLESIKLSGKEIKE